MIWENIEEFTSWITWQEYVQLCNKLPTVFQRVFTMLHPQQQRMRILGPHHHQHLVLSAFWILAMVTGKLEEGVCYYQCILLAKLYQPLPCFILYSKAKFACYSSYFLTSYFCIPVPYDEKDIFLGCQFWKALQVFMEPFSFSFFSITGWDIDWITVILNGLPWKRTEIILSFLRLHPSTAFQTLLLTIMATPFLLRK